MNTMSKIVCLSLAAWVSLFSPIAVSADIGNSPPSNQMSASSPSGTAEQLDAEGFLHLNLTETDIRSPAEETADGYVVFDFSGVTGITGVTAKLDPTWCAKAGKGLILTIDSIGGLSISSPAWQEIANTGTPGTMELTLKKGGIAVSLTQDGKAVDWSTSGSPMVVGMPSSETDDPDDAVIYKNNGPAEPKHLISGSWHEDGFVYALAYSTGEYGLQFMGKAGFTDTEGQWMDRAANYLAARNVITGEEQGLFKPEKHLTRAEFTVMLMDMFDVRLQGLWMPKPYNDQKDVPQWAAETVLQATAMGILTADRDGNFYPNADITRQDMFSITYNLMNKLGVIEPSEGGMVLRKFSDSDKIAEYAYIPMLTLAQNGLISGSRNTLNPAQPATKAEIAQFLYNALQYDVKKTNANLAIPRTAGLAYASANGDVTGDGISDDVSLRGRQTPDSPFVKGVTLAIREGATGNTTDIPLENNTGYKPSLFLGDFNDDGSDDILTSLESGGSGAFTYDEIFSFAGGNPVVIFSSDSYNQAYEYGVSYQDGCKVEVFSKNNNTTYTLDIGNRGRDYLSQIYDSSNKLIKSAEGFVNPLSSFWPADVDRDGVYELLACQKIAGLYNADSLGYVENFLKWDTGRFMLFNQYIAIDGIRYNPIEEYTGLQGRNAPPSELLAFATDNLSKMNKKDADIVVRGLIDAQKLKLKSDQDKLFSPAFNVKINSFSMKDLQNPGNIKDSDLKSFLTGAFGDGLKLFEAEGMKDLEIDFEARDNDFSKYVSDELAAYLGIMAATTRQHPFEDGALMISWDQLANRIVVIEDYLKNYPAGQNAKELNGLHGQYLNIYLLGLSNTPAFDMETGVIKPDALQSFTTSKNKFRDSGLSSILADYLQVLEKSENRKTDEVLQYVRKISGNPN